MYNAAGEPPLEMNGTADAASSFGLLSLDAALPYLNPWNLSVAHWLVGFVLIRGAIAFYDNLVEFLIRFSKVPKLPTREDAATGEPKEVYFKGWAISFVYLVINAADEWIWYDDPFIWHSDAVPKTLGGLNPLNTAAALCLILVLDFFYAPATLPALGPRVLHPQAPPPALPRARVPGRGQRAPRRARHRRVLHLDGRLDRRGRDGRPRRYHFFFFNIRRARHAEPLGIRRGRDRSGAQLQRQSAEATASTTPTTPSTSWAWTSSWAPSTPTPPKTRPRGRSRRERRAAGCGEPPRAERGRRATAATALRYWWLVARAGVSSGGGEEHGAFCV